MSGAANDDTLKEIHLIYQDEKKNLKITGFQLGTTELLNNNGTDKQPGLGGGGPRRKDDDKNNISDELVKNSLANYDTSTEFKVILKTKLDEPLNIGTVYKLIIPYYDDDVSKMTNRRVIIEVEDGQRLQYFYDTNGEKFKKDFQVLKMIKQTEMTEEEKKSRGARGSSKGGSKRGGKKSRKPKSKRIRVRKTRRRKH